MLQSWELDPACFAQVAIPEPSMQVPPADAQALPAADDEVHAMRSAPIASGSTQGQRMTAAPRLSLIHIYIPSAYQQQVCVEIDGGLDASADTATGAIRDASTDTTQLVVDAGFVDAPIDALPDDGLDAG